MCPGRLVRTLHRSELDQTVVGSGGRHTYPYTLYTALAFRLRSRSILTLQHIDEIMLKVWIILAAAACAVSVSAIKTSQKQKAHGDYLSLELPERTHKLEFSSANEEDHITLWKRDTFLPSKAIKGVVYSSGDGWTFNIKHVTFDDEGTYTLRNFWDHVIASYIVKVKTKRNLIECIPGETLKIPLEGIKVVDATLNFYSNSSAVTLVENGVAVGRTHPDYVNRLTVSSEKIQLSNVNVSDLGRYELKDHKGRNVSNTTMILVDHHSFTPNKGLLALFLLGVPGGICFCCRRRICKRCRTNKSQEGENNTLNPLPESVPICHPVTDPSQGYPTHPDQGQIYYPPPDQGQIHYPAPDQGPIPYPAPNQGPIPYPAPDQGPTPYPSPPQWNGQPTVPPNPGFNPGFAPENPVYPPGVPPAQPPQYNVPPNQYNPPAPVNYNPVMNCAPSGPEPTVYKINEPSPAASLLAPQPESSAPKASVDILNSSASADVQFDIDKGKSSTNNFL